MPPQGRHIHKGKAGRPKKVKDGACRIIRDKEDYQPGAGRKGKDYEL
jgi:hypothetical protein